MGVYRIIQNVLEYNGKDFLRNVKATLIVFHFRYLGAIMAGETKSKAWKQFLAYGNGTGTSGMDSLDK